MSKVAIVTDSVASIPDALLVALDIHRGEVVLRELVTIRRDAFYRWLPTTAELPSGPRRSARLPPSHDANPLLARGAGPARAAQTLRSGWPDRHPGTCRRQNGQNLPCRIAPTIVPRRRG
jgi:hypothetical protein